MVLRKSKKRSIKLGLLWKHIYHLPYNTSSHYWEQVSDREYEQTL
jgi:hypothetical protein